MPSPTDRPQPPRVLTPLMPHKPGCVCVECQQFPPAPSPAPGPAPGPDWVPHGRPKDLREQAREMLGDHSGPMGTARAALPEAAFGPSPLAGLWASYFARSAQTEKQARADADSLALAQTESSPGAAALHTLARLTRQRAEALELLGEVLATLGQNMERGTLRIECNDPAIAKQARDDFTRIVLKWQMKLIELTTLTP